MLTAAAHWHVAAQGKGKDKKEKGGDVEGVSVEELNQKITTLEKEKNKEEEYRNYMQLERDKINAFWEITRKDLEDKKAELRNKDREMEEMEERHQVEIKVYKQKVKHLLYEHQNNITTLKADGDMALKLQQDEFRKNEGQMGRDKRSLKLALKEQELAHEDVVRHLKLEQAKESTKMREGFELNARQLEQKCALPPPPHSPSPCFPDILAIHDDMTQRGVWPRESRP